MAVVAVNPAEEIAVRRSGRSRYRRSVRVLPEGRRVFLLTFAVLRVLLVLQRFNGVSTSLRSRLAPAVLLIRA